MARSADFKAPLKPVDIPSMPFKTASKIGLILRAASISGVSNMLVIAVATSFTPSIIARLNLAARISNCALIIVKMPLPGPNAVRMNVPAASTAAMTFAAIELIESAAWSLMLSKAILKARPNSPSLIALSASVKPPIAFDAPVRISPSFMPAPAASNRVNKSVATSSAGAILSSSPAANSRNLPFATLMLSEMLSKAPALRSITPGMLPS